MAESQLGKYHIVEEIGRGGFATVYRAEDTTLGREVALKVLDPLLMRDDTFVARFQREARAAARLDHPHIVPIFEVGEDGGRLYIAMRLVRGHSLAALLQERGRLSWDESLRILKQVGNALAYAHAEGVVHRDIKPDNILIDERSGALLSDFGFAQLVGSSSLTLSLSGGIVGTPAYIPPEIWDGKTATPASDIYALGCVLYEMLMGQALFDGATPMAVMRAHDQGAPLPETWPLDVPPDVAGIMPQALARDPAGRYPHIAAFMDALDAVQTAAVAERVAAETARLLQEMADALEQGRFETVLTLGEALFKLQPDHAEGETLVKQARERLAQRHALEKHLAEARASVNAEQTHLQTERTQWEAQRAALDEKAQQRQAEIARLEQLLKALADEQETEQQQRQAFEEQLNAAEARQEEIQQRVAGLDHLAELLEQGQLEKVETELTDKSTATPSAPTRTQPVTPPVEQEIAEDDAATLPALGFPAQRVKLSPTNVNEISRLWALRTAGEEVFFSPNNQVMATASISNRGVIVWELAAAQPGLRIEISNFSDLAFSPDSKSIAIAYWDSVSLWNIATRKFSKKLEFASTLRSVCFTPDGKTLIVGCSDGHIRLWDLKYDSVQNFANMNKFLSVNSVEFVDISPNGNALIAAGGADFKVWSFNSKHTIATCNVKNNIQTMAFSKDGRFLASQTVNGEIMLWQTKDYQPLRELGEKDATCSKVILSPDGELLVSIVIGRKLDIWRTADNKRLKTVARAVRNAAFSPDGTILAWVLMGGNIELWGIPA